MATSITGPKCVAFLVIMFEMFRNDRLILQGKVVACLMKYRQRRESVANRAEPVKAVTLVLSRKRAPASGKHRVHRVHCSALSP